MWDPATEGRSGFVIGKLSPAVGDREDNHTGSCSCAILDGGLQSRLPSSEQGLL